MRFFKIEDMYYFSKEGLSELRTKYNSKKLIKVFELSDVINEMKSDDIENADFVTFFLPENLSQDFAGIEMIRVPNKFGLLTKEQKERNVSAFEILENKIGAKTYAPKVTFKDYIIDKKSADFQNLMAQIKMIDVKKKSGLPLKGFFLTGVPGTGKTFFAKCVAGELNRVLIHLNLSIFINANDTFGLLQSFFDFFKYNTGEYVVLIDEIEKMLTGNNPKTKQVLGYLLTALNDFGEVNYKSEVFFIATANNITELARENPELFRKGRFDMAIYLTAPNSDKATEIFDFYISLLVKKFNNATFPFLIETAYEILKNGKSEKCFSIGSKAEKIVNDICNNADFSSKIDLSLEDIKKDEGLQEFYKNLKAQNTFSLDIPAVIVDIFIVYRDLIVDRELFPYVPAEIEQMLVELYSLYYFDGQEIDYNSYFKKNVPIQLAMQKGILDMNSATQNFVRF